VSGALDTPTARRVGQLIRLMASDKDGEVIAAVHAIKRTLGTKTSTTSPTCSR